MNRTKHIAFVCLHGSAKSLMAAEYLNRRAADEGLALRASSAGREPDAQVPAHVVAGLREKGIDVAGKIPVEATVRHLASADRVVAFGCDVPADVKSVDQWKDCPAVVDGFEPAWQHITRRVDQLIESENPAE